MLLHGFSQWASEQTTDSLALACTCGPLSFFITMTCNPDSPEIKSHLQPGQHAYNTPFIVTWAFKIWLQRLMHILKTKMGSLTYMTASTEFQKWGFPHSHIVIQVSSHFLPPIVVVACAVSEHRSRGPVESCGSCVTLHKLCYCFLSHGTLCCVRGSLQNHFHCSVSLSFAPNMSLIPSTAVSLVLCHSRALWVAFLTPTSFSLIFMRQ